MPDWIIVVVLGLIEGITEFIPVSSTGHLLIAEHLMRVQESDLFNIVIQCGAVIAVLPLFPERLHKFVFEWRRPETQDYLLKILAAFVITGGVGFVLDKKGFKLGENPLPIAWALLVGGLAFLAIEWWLHLLLCRRRCRPCLPLAKATPHLPFRKSLRYFRKLPEFATGPQPTPVP